MCHLSVSLAPNLRKTTWLPKSDLTSLDTNSVGPNCLWLKDTCEKSCVAYIHPLIVQFRFHHFATFAIINSIEQHCFRKSRMAQLSAQQKTTTKQEKRETNFSALPNLWTFLLSASFLYSNWPKLAVKINAKLLVQFWFLFFEGFLNNLLRKCRSWCFWKL